MVFCVPPAPRWQTHSRLRQIEDTESGNSGGLNNEIPPTWKIGHTSKPGKMCVHGDEINDSQPRENLNDLFSLRLISKFRSLYLSMFRKSIVDREFFFPSPMKLTDWIYTVNIVNKRDRCWKKNPPKERDVDLWPLSWEDLFKEKPTFGSRIGVIAS